MREGVQWGMALLAADGDRRGGRDDERRAGEKKREKPWFLFPFLFRVRGRGNVFSFRFRPNFEAKENFTRDGSWESMTGKKKFWWTEVNFHEEKWRHCCSSFLSLRACQPAYTVQPRPVWILWMTRQGHVACRKLSGDSYLFFLFFLNTKTIILFTKLLSVLLNLAQLARKWA